MIGEEFLEGEHDCVGCGGPVCDCTADTEEDCMTCEVCQYGEDYEQEEEQETYLD